MTRRQLIKAQLLCGLPEPWITDELIEAVELALGGQVLKFPAPEMAEPRHAAAICRYARKVEEING